MNYPTKRITEVDQVSVPDGLDEVYIKQDGAFVRIPLAALLQAYAIVISREGLPVPVPGQIVTEREYAALVSAQQIEPMKVYWIAEELAEEAAT